MANLKVIVLLVVALIVGACAPIKSMYMLGDYALKTSADEWNGTWVYEDDSFQVDVLNPDFGIFELESNINGESEEHRVFATQSDDANYMNLVDAEKNFFFVKFKKEKDSITVWFPSKGALTKAIEGNEIKGEVGKDGDILITASSNEFREYFKSNQNQMLFDLENPRVFKRLAQ